jgi:P-type Ca2+ transporter type 2C
MTDQTVTQMSGQSAPAIAEAHRLATDDAARTLAVDVEQGLSTSEATSRLAKYGPNQLAEKEKEPGWKAFLRQYQDLIQIVLLGAAVINQVATGETGTTLVLAGLTVFNAILGLSQEAKAEAALASLQQMLKTVARVRRDGQVMEIDAEELVPGDIVLVEAGNVSPQTGGSL